MNQRKRMMEFEFRMGCLYGALGLYLVLFFTLIFSGLYSRIVILFSSYFIIIVLLSILGRRDVMFTWLKEWLGIKHITMKMEALASYLKVKFVHVPEHYECQKVSDE